MRTRWFLLGMFAGGVASFFAVVLSLTSDRSEEEEDDL